MKETILVEMIERKIYLIRGHKVMLDTDLAGLYEAATSHLNKAVKRNIDRFPPDFMFQLTKEEMDSLRFQFGILKPGEQAGNQKRANRFQATGEINNLQAEIQSSLINSATFAGQAAKGIREKIGCVPVFSDHHMILIPF